MSLKIKRYITKSFKKYFLESIIHNGKLLDVGCGNNSPYNIKSIRPDLYYVGLDIGVYNQSTDYSKYANEFILTNPINFHLKIQERQSFFDAILCAHNLEHCNDYILVTLAMIQALKKNGIMYLSFPCEESVNFPKRSNTLNFYDDPTHKNLINYVQFISFLKNNSMEILLTTKRHRPLISFFIGLLCEPFCFFLKKQAPRGGSWALYGFESIIIAKKI